MSPTALVADDEPLLADDLAKRLEKAWPELSIVGVCHDGEDALARLERHKPDIAFLDIRMPGRSGLDVAARLDFPCHVVFVTAYDQYAVQAFERAAVDYVLKPPSDERLADTVKRLQRALAQGAITQAGDLRSVLRDLMREAATAPAPLKWIRASVGDSVRLVPIDDVRYFQATDRYTSVVLAGSQLLIRTPLKELLAQLDADVFWQVHRGTIVNVRHVAGARHDGQGRLWLTLRDRPEPVAVSRSYAHLFRQM